MRAAEQLVGLEVAPGERQVTIEFLPVFRATLFILGIATEAVVFLLVVWLAIAELRTPPVPMNVLSTRFCRWTSPSES